MADRMREVRERLENISKQRQEFSFTAGNSSYAQQVIDDRATSSEVIEVDVLGRDQDKQKVMTLLSQASSSSDFIILPIYGIGGIGKTTLAKLVFNDAHFMDYEKAWVYVSQTFDSNKVAEIIRSERQNNQTHLTNTQEPDTDPPAPKNILIVLDDLWENRAIKIDELKRSLKLLCSGRNKVHVIVTTRDAEIASKIQTTEAYAIEPLSSDVCWNIIKQIVGFEDNDKESLENIGKEIAMKCQGVALAARVLGYMLRSKNFEAWVSVKENGMWNKSTTEKDYDDVLASLKLSYSSMPLDLRLCFTYCAIFPKGHKMAKDHFIYQWAALGFIESSNEDSSWLQHGEGIIKQLLGMSFLQHSNSPSVSYYILTAYFYDKLISLNFIGLVDPQTTKPENLDHSNY